MIADEIFGRENFISTNICQKIHSTKNDAKYFSDNHDYIFVYSKNLDSIQFNLLGRTDEMNERYKNPDNDPRGVWQSGDLVANEERKNGYHDVISPKTGKVFNVQKGKRRVYGQETMEALIRDNSIWFGKDGNSFPRKKRFLSEVSGRKANTWWDSKEVGHNQEAKREIIKLFGKEDPFSTPKPERLLQRIIHLATNDNDIVLDFFAGSGTTAAVAHKMGRKFITTEQMDYVNTVTVERLRKVIEGEQGGISKSVDWQGGGSFVYAELMQYNQLYIEKIQDAKTKDALLAIWQEMQAGAFLSYQFDRKAFNERLEAFKTAPIEQMKQFLVEVLDKNQLYVNYSEIEDETFKVSAEDIKLNNQFYAKR